MVHSPSKRLNQETEFKNSVGNVINYGFSPHETPMRIIVYKCRSLSSDDHEEGIIASYQESLNKHYFAKRKMSLFFTFKTEKCLSTGKFQL